MRIPFITYLAVLALVAHCAPVDTRIDSINNTTHSISPAEIRKQHDDRGIHGERAVTRGKGTAASGKKSAGGTKKVGASTTPAKGKKPPPKANAAGTRKSPSTHSSATTPHVAASHSLSLSSLIKDFTAPSHLTMKGKSTKSTVLSTAAMNDAKIPKLDKLKPGDPRHLSLTLGTVNVALKGRSRYVAKTQKLLEEATASVRTAGSSCTMKQCLLPINGEPDLTEKMMHMLAWPAAHILEAMHDPIPAVNWHIEGLGGPPKTDIVLRHGGAAKVVIEVKTPTALTDSVIDTILRDLGSYEMTYRIPQSKSDSSTALSLTHKGNKAFFRDKRTKDVVMLEQVIAQMYDSKVNYGALTNFNTWLLFKRSGNHFTVSKHDGIVNGQNKGMELMLGLSLKALNYPL